MEMNCMYDYRFEYEKANVIDNCCNCDCNIYEGDTYWDIDGKILCKECLTEYEVIGD